MGLIVAIGAQNVWVLSMSIKRIHIWPVVITCFSIDSILMASGVYAFNAFQRWLPHLIPVFTYIGIAMLCLLAFMAAVRVIKGNSGLKAQMVGNITAVQAVGLALAMSLLNPHVYLDTVVLVGSIASATTQPWLFWLGAASASTFWFSLLAAIGGPLGRWLTSELRWRYFDGFICIVMLWVAWGLFNSIN